jgi:hypothetical protein
MMQARFSADITNDGNEDVLILDGDIEGTTPQIPFTERIDVPAGETVMGENIFVFGEPVVGEGGKDFTGKVILPDQCETSGEPLLLPHFFSEWTKRSGIGTSRSSQSFGRNPYSGFAVTRTTPCFRSTSDHVQNVTSFFRSLRCGGEGLFRVLSDVWLPQKNFSSYSSS